MNADGAPSLRPAGFGEIFGSAVRIWWRTLPIAALAAFLVLAPAYAVAFAIGAIVAPEALGETLFSGGEVDVDAEEAARAGSATLLTAAITLIASVVAFAACFKAVVSAYAGASRRLGSTLAHGLARGGSAFWVALLIVFVIIGVALAAIGLVAAGAALGPAGAVLVGLPVLVGVLVLFTWLGVSWSVALAAVLADDQRGTQALRRSRELVSGRWWATFGVLAVAWIAILACSIVLSLLVTVPFSGAESDLVRLGASNAAGLLTGALTTPLWASFVAVLYYDFRFRKEELSLEDAARSVGARRDPSAQPLAPLAPAEWDRGYELGGPALPTYPEERRPAD